MYKQFIAVLTCFCAMLSLQAKTLYVDSKASSTGTGTALSPYKQIQSALNRIQPGVVIKIAPGTYRECLSVYQSGTRDEPVVLEPWKKGQPIIDGSYFEEGRHSALLHLKNVSNIQIKGLAFKNFKTNSSVSSRHGVLVEGYGENIVFENCEISGIKSEFGYSPESSAFTAIGRDEVKGIMNLQLTGMVIHSCSGIASSISLKGNIEGANIETSRLHHNECSGIQLLGHRGFSNSSIVDMPRSCVIRKSYLHDLHSRQFHSGTFIPAKAIFSDGSENLLVESCRIQKCDAGIEIIASKKGLGSKNSTIRNNWIQENENSAIILGSRDFNSGKVESVKVINNTLIENDQANSGKGELQFRYHVIDCVTKNNLFIPNAANGVSQYVSQLSKKQVPDSLVMSNNFYVKRGQSYRWEVGFRESRGYESWLSQGFDRDSQFGDLLFDNNGNPHTFAQIKDKGDSSVSQSFEDIDGNPRVIGQGLDIGAKEW